MASIALSNRACTHKSQKDIEYNSGQDMRFVVTLCCSQSARARHVNALFAVFVRICAPGGTRPSVAEFYLTQYYRVAEIVNISEQSASNMVLVTSFK